MPIVLSVLVACFIAVAPVHAGSPDVLRITTGDSPPFSSASLPGQGITIRVIREALRRAGYELEVVFYPWKRAWSEAVANERLDGTAYWFRAEWRERDFHYSAPLISERYVFFHLKSNPLPAWEQLSELSSQRLGATLAYTYNHVFREHAARGMLNVEWVHSDEINFRKLLRGRIDAFPLGILVGYYLLHTRFPAGEVAKVSHHGKPLFALFF